jgi:hypothetical protein
LAVISEFLREEQREDKVTKQEDGENECDYRDPIHGLPQLLARLDVEKRQDEENCREN